LYRLSMSPKVRFAPTPNLADPEKVDKSILRPYKINRNRMRRTDQMATAKPRVGRPRIRAESPGDYVGFRAPRELKQRLEAAAVRSGRSLSTEAQIRLERSFEKQDLLGSALELAYGSRFGGILLLAAEMAAEVGRLAGYTSGESHAAILNWIEDPFAYDQAA